ncbi:16S rRNA (guanine(966)-N(2))-methyltransferase RsmD [Flagellatimonas centrodinii]|uniref:16S rRNA (guanine(966)-N(2))-methyltransferase RsmD n=1 Tax=Flagellatimonas centrodinii TaxID=2806210 RepID=UPI001FEDE5CE|nr:16S rRNA (guanine(966)-N(2))-methyltransferase RsmD [Flagellatimonas centrodinii]ULQ47183.1 16S rRNA (guanine(966)-N(2))-methyltransferase RsmD [Flagellatimonas centrodinii]
MAKRPLGTLRIIGGTHRSRQIEFDAAAGVRPTPDRVRQTLFDWLAPVIHGARCLDLFAGSGALGLEAVSRGAAHVTFVETGSRQAAMIRDACRLLKADNTDVTTMDALYFIEQTWHRYHVVFIDPPYGGDTLERALIDLPKCLAPGARVYLEWPAGAPPALPPGLTLHREKKAGKVCFALAIFDDAGVPTA